MTYVVVWEDQATSDIDQAWKRASGSSRHQLIVALEHLEAILKDNPAQVGESRDHETRRVVVCGPLVANYSVSERLNIVRVVAARVYGII